MHGNKDENLFWLLTVKASINTVIYKIDRLFKVIIDMNKLEDTFAGDEKTINE